MCVGTGIPFRLRLVGVLMEMGFSKAAIDAAMIAEPEVWTKDSLGEWLHILHTINEERKEE